MSTLIGEQLQTLAEARVATPGKPDPSTLWRWAHRGVRGVRLETILIGGRRYTSAEAMARFIERLSVAPQDGVKRTTPASR
jgi:hypothetical protein